MRSFLLLCAVVLLASSCATRIHTRPANVTVVKRTATYKVAYVKGKQYYLWNGRYHKKTKWGYVVVRL